jgi:hypothetical protein
MPEQPVRREAEGELMADEVQDIEIGGMQHSPIEVHILRMLCAISRDLHRLRHEVRKMSETQQQLDAAITQVQQDDVAILSAVNTTGTAVSTALQDLLAKIAANPTAPVSDFTAEVASLTQVHTDFTGALASLQTTAALATGDDPGAQPAPTTDAGTDGATTAVSTASSS